MSIQSICFFYNASKKDGNLIGHKPLKHYDNFMQKLSRQLTIPKIEMIHTLDKITPGSLVIMYSYGGFFKELDSLLQTDSLLSYRQFFIVSNPFATLQMPCFYQQKSFMGSMWLQSYRDYVNNTKQMIGQCAFYADELATEQLQVSNELWQTTNGEYGYKSIYCGEEFFTPLAIFINEYA